MELRDDISRIAKQNGLSYERRLDSGVEHKLAGGLRDIESAHQEIARRWPAVEITESYMQLVIHDDADNSPDVRADRAARQAIAAIFRRGDATLPPLDVVYDTLRATTPGIGQVDSHLAAMRVLELWHASGGTFAA